MKYEYTQRNLADALLRLGDACRKRERDDEARDAYEEALPIVRQMIEAAPDDRSLQSLLRRAKRNPERLTPSP